MISEEAVDRVLVDVARGVSATLSSTMHERAHAGRLNAETVSEVFDLACRSAFQVGLTLGLRIAIADRIGAEDLVAGIETYVHHNDEPAITAERVLARQILEEIYR